MIVHELLSLYKKFQTSLTYKLNYTFNILSKRRTRRKTRTRQKKKKKKRRTRRKKEEEEEE